MWGAMEILAVLSIECLDVGLNTISKASMIKGMNTFVFTAYSSAIGLLFIFPLTFFYHRVVTPPKLTFSIVGRIFLLGLIGYFVTIFSFVGIGYSSPTMASAMNNLTPAYTFILALITRMEKLDLKLRSSQTKLIGTIVSVVGALTVTLYKGQTIFFVPQNSPSTLNHYTLGSSTQENWVLGGIFLAASSFSLALLIILQTGIVKDYPSEVNITLIATMFSAITSTIVSLIVVKEAKEWELHLDLELITILYSAILMVVCRNVITSWVLRKKGPVFVTMFKPLDVIIALIMGITFLRDSLYIGRVVTPPKLTFSIVCRICLLGFIGYSVSILNVIGIGYSSPTMASAILNLTPAFTFILARITRMEKLDLKSKSSQAKFIGTIVSVLGALTVTFYQGPTIIFAPQTSSDSFHHTFQYSTQQNWVFGGLILAASSFSLAVLIIFQTGVIRDYPHALIVTLIGTGFSTVISTVVSLIVVRNPNEWNIRLDLELITILYSAIFTVVCGNVFTTWVLRKKGPVFVTMFKPLDMIIALVMGITFLRDSLYIGSLIGAFLIALGFYSVLWGKANEEKAIDQDCESPISSNLSFDKLPLLSKENIKH